MESEQIDEATLRQRFGQAAKIDIEPLTLITEK
jgi:hypothetical protein